MRLSFGCALCFVPACCGSDDFLAAVLERARVQMGRLPDYVCAQTVERAERGPAQDQFRVKDRLHLEVTSIAGKERFAKADSSRFDDRELRDLVTRGVVSTGGFALFLKHVAQAGAAEFRPGAAAQLGDRAVRRYEFHVPHERSGYTISVPPHQARVAFHGSLLADAESREILRLEVIADEIPQELGFDRTHTVLNYRNVAVGETEFPFAADTETLAVSMEGSEYRNRAALGACRQYGALSTLSFESESGERKVASAPAAATAPVRLTARLLLDVEMDGEIDLATVTPDTAFRARLAGPLRDGDTVIAPEGTPVRGVVLEIERLGKPVDRFEVVLRLEALEPAGAAALPLLAARLRDTSGAAGLIKQERRLMPAFDKKRANRFNVLVRETGEDYAVLYWEARHPRIKKGFRMRWLTGTASE